MLLSVARLTGRYKVEWMDRKLRKGSKREIMIERVRERAMRYGAAGFVCFGMKLQPRLTALTATDNSFGRAHFGW